MVYVSLRSSLNGCPLDIQRPVIVVGAMVNDKPTWTLVAHAGTVAHSHLKVSLVQAHYINKGIRENKKLSVNVVDESWLQAADRMGIISGNKEDKSEAFAWTMGENGVPLIDDAIGYGGVCYAIILLWNDGTVKNDS